MYSIAIPLHLIKKGTCEVTHEYVRRVLPKGTSFQDLDQNFINYIYSHINSTYRKEIQLEKGDQVRLRIFQKNGHDAWTSPVFIR